jgi:hypothetical protein
VQTIRERATRVLHRMGQAAMSDSKLREQARIRRLLAENSDLTVDQIKAALGREGISVSTDLIADIRADVLHCRRLLEEDGLLGSKDD